NPHHLFSLYCHQLSTLLQSSRHIIYKLYITTTLRTKDRNQLTKQRKDTKKDIHPEYRTVVFLDTSSDYKFLSGSTRSSDETIEWEDGNTYALIRVEISSATHPFYTGKQKADKVGGRIDRFKKKYNLK